MMQYLISQVSNTSQIDTIVLLLPRALESSDTNKNSVNAYVKIKHIVWITKEITVAVF